MVIIWVSLCVTRVPLRRIFHTNGIRVDETSLIIWDAIAVPIEQCLRGTCLFVVDTCYAGSAIDIWMESTKKTTIPRIAYFTATDDVSLGPESEDDLTKRICRVLSGNTDALEMSASDIIDHLYEDVFGDNGFDFDCFNVKLHQIQIRHKHMHSV